MCPNKEEACIRAITIIITFLAFLPVFALQENNVLISIGRNLERMTEVSTTYVGRDLYGNPTLYVRGGVSFDNNSQNEIINALEAEVGYHIPEYEWTQIGLQLKKRTYSDNPLAGIAVTLVKNIDKKGRYSIYLRGDYSKYLKENDGFGDYIKDDYNLEIGIQGYFK